MPGGGGPIWPFPALSALFLRPHPLRTFLDKRGFCSQMTPNLAEDCFDHAFHLQRSLAATVIEHLCLISWQQQRPSSSPPNHWLRGQGAARQHTSSLLCLANHFTSLSLSFCGQVRVWTPALPSSQGFGKNQMRFGPSPVHPTAAPGERRLGVAARKGQTLGAE